jgi:adenosylhomocysteine nucleosidase
MIALLAALEQEIANLRKLFTIEERFTWRDYEMFKGTYGEKAVLLVRTGLGKERAEIVTHFILEHYPVTTLISLGFAGALTEETKAGDVILCSSLYCSNGQHAPVAENRSDAGLVSLLSQTLKETAISFRQGSSVTVAEPVSTPEAKRALGRAYPSEIVDMEGYWVARIASASKTKFMAVRSVSDTVPDSVPNLSAVLDPTGRWHWKRAIPHFLFQPTNMVKLFTLYRNSQKAKKSLAIVVDQLLAVNELDREYRD